MELFFMLAMSLLLLGIASRVRHIQAKGNDLRNELRAIPTCDSVILGSTMFPCAKKICRELPQNVTEPGVWYKKNCLHPTRPTVVMPFFNSSNTVFNHTRTQGENVVLKCRVSGFNSNFILKWTKRDKGSTLAEPIFISTMQNPKDRHRNFSMVLSSDNQSTIAEVRIFQLGPSDAGDYRCIFQANFKTESDLSGEQLYRVHVRYPARVWSIGPRVAPFWRADQPGKIYVNETDNITLTCIADGYPTPIVSWRLHDPPSLSERMNSFTNPDGSFHIQQITRNYSGTYTCRSQNYLNRGKFATKKVQLIVQYPPHSDRSYEEHKKGDGRFLRLQGSFIGLPVPTYHWLKNGKRLSNIYNKSSEAVSGRILVIIGLQPEKHYANYTCVATNILGSGSVTFDVNGTPFPPRILNEQAKSTRRRSFNLSWSPGLNTEHDIPVTSYKLLYRRLEIKSVGNERKVIYHPSDAPNSFKVPGATRHCSLTELKENSTYELEICPENDYGKGQCANFTFFTPNEDKIISPTVIEQTENSAELIPASKLPVSRGRASCSTLPSVGCLSTMFIFCFFCLLNMEIIK